MKVLKILVGSGAVLMMLGRACVKNADNLRHIPLNQLDNVRYLDDIPTSPPPVNTYVLPEKSLEPKLIKENEFSPKKVKEMIEKSEIIRELEELDSMDLNQ